jgi:hypothetical protein
MSAGVSQERGGTDVIKAKAAVTKPFIEALSSDLFAPYSHNAPLGYNLCSKIESVMPQTVAITARMSRFTKLDMGFS